MPIPAAFPLLKLGAVFMKQISKPIANFTQNYAKSHPFFRRYVCLPPARMYNWSEFKLKMWILTFDKPVNITVLNEDMAIELGANLLGEFVVFSIAAVLVIMEVNRSARKDAVKEAARKQEVANLTSRVQDLYKKIEQQDAQIQEMHRNVVELSASTKPSLPEPQQKLPKSPPIAPKIIPIDNNLQGNSKRPQNLVYSQNVGLTLNTVLLSERDLLEADKEIVLVNGFVTNALRYVEHNVFKSSMPIHKI